MASRREALGGFRVVYVNDLAVLNSRKMTRPLTLGAAALRGEDGAKYQVSRQAGPKTPIAEQLSAPRLILTVWFGGFPVRRPYGSQCQPE